MSNIAQRLVDAAVAQGADSPAARLLVDIVEAASEAATAASTLDDMPEELLRRGHILAAFPEFGALADAIDRAWLTA